MTDARAALLALLAVVAPTATPAQVAMAGLSVERQADGSRRALVSNALAGPLQVRVWDPAEPRAAMEAAIEIARASDTKVALTLSDGFVVERHLAALGGVAGEVRADFDRVEIAHDEERRVLEVLTVVEQLLVGGLEVGADKRLDAGGEVAMVGGLDLPRLLRAVLGEVDDKGDRVLGRRGFLALVGGGEVPDVIDRVVVGDVLQGVGDTLDEVFLLDRVGHGWRRLAVAGPPL